MLQVPSPRPHSPIETHLGFFQPPPPSSSNRTKNPLLPLFMGPPSVQSVKDYARVAAERLRRLQVARPGLESLDSRAGAEATSVGVAPGAMEAGERRLPLSEVVADCARRWFQDALKEARAGDAAMQVLVGQMYQSGYGVARNEQKAKAWIAIASRYRSSVWKVSEKHPGYNASDSDSDDVKEDMKQ